MANGNGRRGSGYSGARRGGDNGNSYDNPFEESRSYFNTYDPDRIQNYSNLPGIAEQQRAGAIIAERERDARNAQRARATAASATHYWPSMGKFVVPEENTWAAHAELVKNPDTGLRFNPAKYVFFDQIIAARAGIRGLYDPSSSDYAKYEGLRTNIAVMRNDLIGHYLQDGSFDPGDEKYVPYIAGIAVALGNDLGNDKWYKRFFTRSMSVDVANVEGVGAAQMYKHLLEIEHKPGITQYLRSSIHSALGIKDRFWNLPPIEETPYGVAGLSAPPPPRKLCVSESALAQADPETKSFVERLAQTQKPLVTQR